MSRPYTGRVTGEHVRPVSIGERLHLASRVGLLRVDLVGSERLGLLEVLRLGVGDDDPAPFLSFETWSMSRLRAGPG